MVAMAFGWPRQLAWIVELYGSGLCIGSVCGVGNGGVDRVTNVALSVEIEEKFQV